MLEIAVIIPVYNEAKRLEITVDKSIEYISKITKSFEIIIAEDGATDNTDLIAERLSEKYPFVRHLHSDVRLGRGAALKRAFSSTNANIVVYYDVDLATDLSHLRELIDAIRNGYDIATGSRLLKSSDVQRPFKRDFASRGFNFFLRLLLRSGIHDHQCGFKAFSRSSIRPLLDEVKDTHWFWDTEVLVRAQQKGFKIYEFPVVWRHGGATKVNLRKDVISMGSKILKLWLEFSSMPIYLMVLMSFLILVLIFIYSGATDVLKYLEGANLFFLIVSVISYLSSYLFRGLRYDNIVSSILNRRLGIEFIVGSIAISQAANLILPLRTGDLVRAYILNNKKGVAYTTGISSLLAERVMDIVAILLLSAVSLPYVASLAIPNWVFLAMAITGALLVLFFIFLFLFDYSRFEKLNKIIGELKTLSTSPMLFIYLLFLSMIIWIIDSIVCYLVSISLGARLPFLLILFAVMIGNIAKTIPVTAGGIGTYEAAVTAILLLLANPAQAFSIAFLDHLVKNIVTLFMGLIYIVVLGVKIDNIRHVEIES